MAQQRFLDNYANIHLRKSKSSGQQKKIIKKPPWDNSFALPQKYEKPQRIFLCKPSEEELLLKRVRYMRTSKRTDTREIYMQPFLGRQPHQITSPKNSAPKTTTPSDVSEARKEFCVANNTTPPNPPGQRRTKKMRRGSAFSSDVDEDRAGASHRNSEKFGERSPPTNIPARKGNGVTSDKKNTVSPNQIENLRSKNFRNVNTHPPEVDKDSPYGKRTSSGNIRVVPAPRGCLKKQCVKYSYGDTSEYVQDALAYAMQAGGEVPAMFAHLLGGRDRNVVRFTNLRQSDSKGHEGASLLAPESVQQLQQRLTDIGIELGLLVGI